jgi:GTP cyclohydrolase I
MTTTPIGVRLGTSEVREVTRPAVEEAVGRVRQAPSPALAAVHEPDLPAATAGARLLLQALGVDLAVSSLARTPERMAAALAELVTPRPFRLTTFPNDGGYDELIVARSIPVRSLCEHHMLPFTGTAHIGYLPGERIVGLSKLARVMEHFSCRPQVQERLTVQVAEWLWTQLSPAGVGVVVEAEHLCMTLRGVQAPGTNTITSSLLGVLREDARSRAEFLALSCAR